MENANTEPAQEIQCPSPSLPAVPSLRKQFRLLLFKVIAVGAPLMAGLGALQYTAYQHRAEKLSAGKQNPILAAQSSGNYIFISHPFLEQFICNPELFDDAARVRLRSIEQEHAIGSLSEHVYRQCLEKFAESVQGFVGEEKILSFTEVVDQIKEKGEQGMKTTLNFGDSSTSGWNSNTVTENAVRLCEELYPYLLEQDPTLPKTFDDYAQSFDVQMFRSTQYPLALSIAAEQLKKHPQYEVMLREHWGEAQRVVASPFLTYATYTDEMNRIDSGHHSVNLGVPGYSSVHGKNYMQTMLTKLKDVDALRFVDAATLYFGNNDSLNNGNVEDKYYIGEQRDRHSAIPPFLKERLSGNFTRVHVHDFEQNMSDMILMLRNQGIESLTMIAPIVPLDWRPGERAVNDGAEAVGQLYKGSSTVSALLDQSREQWIHYKYETGIDDRVSSLNDGVALQKALDALKKDFLVPRRKQAYIETIAKLAEKLQVNFIHLEGVLPIVDMSNQNASAKNSDNITNDYCHPGEHANLLLALAVSVLRDNTHATQYCAAAMAQLVTLGVEQDVARREVEFVTRHSIVRAGDDGKIYQDLGSAKRTRSTWKDVRF